MKPGNGSTKIRAVILDYGQVLAGSPTKEEFGRLAGMFNVSFDSFYRLWEESRGPYDRGDFTPEEYWLKLAAQTNSVLNHRQIEILRQVEVEIWSRPYPDMLAWVRRLRAAGIKTGLLSNMPWDLVTHLRKNCDWLNDFVFTTFSAEVRLIKPDLAIYQHTLKGLGAAAGQTLFIDDREDNIRAARSLGIHGVQFESVPVLEDRLEKLGFPILPTAST